jgi:hypothetical protein
VIVGVIIITIMIIYLSVWCDCWGNNNAFPHDLVSGPGFVTDHLLKWLNTVVKCAVVQR